MKIGKSVWKSGLLLALVAGHAAGQANFAESFQGVGDGDDLSGGPPELINRGWSFRNQSNPNNGNSPYWTEMASGWGHVGSCLGHGAFTTWANSSSRTSAWIILPAVANQVAGDPLTFWTSAPVGTLGTNNANLEIRYSPTGDTSTGSSVSDVGSFTQVLSTISGQSGHAWTQRSMVVPGPGRLAMRLVFPPASSRDSFGGSIMIDTLRIGNPPPLAYPLPAAGQTVHWTTAMSPVQLSVGGTGQSPRIVPGGTVIVDPGVEIRVGNNVNFDVSGNLSLQGTAANPVRLRGNTGGGAGWARITVANGGVITGAFADVETYTDLLCGGKASFTDTAFRDPSNPTGFSYDSAGDLGHRFFDGNLAYQRQIINLERCTFGQGCQVVALRGWVAARDCTFYRGSKVTVEPGAIGGEAMYIVGGSILDNVTVTEAYVDLTHDNKQHRYIGNVSVTGNPYGPGIRLQGGASYLIDPSVTLQANKWPVNFGGDSAGILPGSRLPVTGNQFNEIPDTDDAAPSDENVVWADAGIPYVHSNNSTLHGQVTILPGVTVKLAQDVSFFFDTDSNGVAMPIFLGESGKPIRFIPYTPGERWYSIILGTTKVFGARWDWCEFEGSRYGVGTSQTPLALDNCVFRDNIRGMYSETLTSLRKCTFENNVFSYSGERFAPLHNVQGLLDANHPTNPNSFINNNGDPGPDFFGSFLPSGGLIARARHNSLENTDSDVRNNWWGTPTGPQEARNPGGTGDAVFFGIDTGGHLLPFLSEPPTTNPPPTVRFVTERQTVVPGEKIHVQWTARDDGTITSQRVYYSPDSNTDSTMELLAEIPANARSFEWTVPTVGTPATSGDQFVRVIATDDLGQEGIADVSLKITNPSDFTGSMVQNPALPSMVRPGDSQSICATISGVVGSMYASIVFDNDETGVSLGGVFANGGQACTVLPAQIPDVSTDRARIRFDATASLNQVRSYYGPYFSIRPDPILGDAAPTVSLTSTHGGQTYSGGDVIPITWTAADDEGLRSFDIRASFDGGTRWFIVARDLDGAVRSFDWQLPASEGVGAVKVRVVAKDLRFQNSSAESGAFTIAAGDWNVPCAADFNADGTLDFFDYLDFVDAFAVSAAAADFNNDGIVDFFDYLDFVNSFSGGC